MSAVTNLQPEAETLLQARLISCRLGERTILERASLSLKQGEVVGLIGPNGAGKSTLLKVIARLVPLSEGEITLCGESIHRFRPDRLARLIGQVAQINSLDAAFTVRDVVLMGRNPHLGRFEIEQAHDQEMADRAMQMTDTLTLADRLITSLSGGERQRVFLARALAQQPQILLLDEPTSSLDLRHQFEILGLVQQLARTHGMGVLMAIHDLSLAARFCDRLILLWAGKVIADGKPDAVLTPPNLACAFEVDAQTYVDPFTGDLKLSIAGIHRHER